MGVKRNPTGPLITAPLYQIQDAVFWGKTVQPNIDAQDDDQPYIVRSFDRLDHIAAVMLGDSQLGWVLLARNDLRLAPNDLVPGMKIFAPTRESLRRRGIIR